jgi:hypothetical protein
MDSKMNLADSQIETQVTDQRGRTCPRMFGANVANRAFTATGYPAATVCWVCHCPSTARNDADPQQVRVLMMLSEGCSTSRSPTSSASPR